MAARSLPQREPGPVALFLGRRLAEFAGLALIAAAGALIVMLAGFDAADPSWNSATDAVVANPLGSIGAGLADIGLQTFGLAVLLLPLALAIGGIRLIWHRPAALPWLPVIALPLALMSWSTLAALYSPLPASWPFRVGLGGVVGDFLYRLLAPSLDTFLPWIGLIAALVTLIAITGLTLREARGLTDGLRWIGGGIAALGALGFGRFHRRTPEAEVDDDEPVAQPRPRRRPAASRRERDATAAPGEVDEPEATEPARPKRQPVVKTSKPVSGKSAGARAELPDWVELEPEQANLPPLDLLDSPRATTVKPDEVKLKATAEELERVLDDFGVRGEIVACHPGPVVTRYDLEPVRGTRAQRVISLSDDIARSMRALSVRVAGIPGTPHIGIELPNDRRDVVALRELLQSPSYEKTSSRLTLSLGKDISGVPQVVDLQPMPHLLIAGTTGSGKSVALNAMILSLLYRLPPSRCKLIMIDPKFIELSVYDAIPHLLSPVITEPGKAIVALKWVVREMDDRYRMMQRVRVRNIDGYNQRLAEAREAGEELTHRVQTGFEPGTGQPVYEEQAIDLTPMPFIVVIIDEVADLMLTAGKEVEIAIQRLAGKARAAGIHLIVATQRPSVDVITGVIKANLPSRISFRVSSKIDSRTILGEPGAEQLLGQGDMLLMEAGKEPRRIHGPLVTEPEIERVVRYLKTTGEPDYLASVTDEMALEESGTGSGFSGPAGSEAADDDIYQQAVQIVAQDNKASTSYLQRKLRIGYNSAARLIERMEDEGIVSPPGHNGKREVLING
ncbi:DNA translocase FtsK [Marinivivus vitaminiproducens]|uniref:DNA translocase FtsK n=1 Tax=Marinivivus vitaminiproducens TaxID=3035935 RepID=UPI0027A21E53|nr:DNA translocase FtsK 4TM domain-containing protein [Geminicoccaceae bacterium SCSIO 64248]